MPDLNVTMMGSAPSLAAAVTGILRRLTPLGVRSPGVFFDLGDDPREAQDKPGWEAKVNAWSGVGFDVSRKGPRINVALEKAGERTIRATVSIPLSAFQRLVADQRRHEQAFYALLFQIALALGARAGVGDLGLDFSPASDKEVEQAIRRHPQSPEESCPFGFLRRDPALPKPGAPYVVTERREGYWLMEHPELFEYPSQA